MHIKRNLLLKAAFGAMLFAFPAAASAQAETARTHFSLYGMHLISGGQSLQVAVQNPRLSDREIIPCIKVTITFDVYEPAADGSVRPIFLRRVLREVELDAGEAASFDFAPDRNGQWVSPMVFVRPEVGSPPESDRERILSTVVVLQGARAFLNLPAVLKGFDPQPDPPASRPDRKSSLGKTGKHL